VPEKLTPEAWEASGADGASLGTVSVKVDETNPRLGDNARGFASGLGDVLHRHQCSREHCLG
jgi:hypothetical protein